jgi:hypothetical protein
MSLLHQFEVEQVKGPSGTVITIFLESEKRWEILMNTMIYSFCSEFVDGCHALLSMASLTTCSLFDNLLKSTRLADCLL